MFALICPCQLMTYYGFIKTKIAVYEGHNLCLRFIKKQDREIKRTLHPKF